MARAICGIHRRSDTNANAVVAMLAALPGSGRTGGTDQGPVSFRYRDLWADPAETAPVRERRSVPGLAVIADARLDNRAELAEAIGLAGPERDGIEDSHLILRAYQRWGEACPPRLHGDYAFAIWNSLEQRLFCARDAVGARPFFYSQLPGGQFSFASDIAAALAAPGVDDRLDDSQVAAFLMATWREGVSGTDGTFFRAVRSLPPGHSITVDAKSERVERWWRPEDAPPVRHECDEDYESEFLDHYRRAVRDRLHGAHPVGVHLSGGLDSSSVAVLAARELRPLGRKPHAFCWHPPPAGSHTSEEADEYRLIESVCAQEQLQPLYHAASADHIVGMLRKDVTRVPNRDGTLLHESLVQDSAAGLGVRVVLSGWGGDEVASYSGAGYYVELLREGRLGQLHREARGLSNRPWMFLLRNVVLPAAHPHAAGILERLLQRELPRRRQSYAAPGLARKYRKPRPFARESGIRQTQLARLKPGHLNRRMEDWAASGSRAGVEYRFPLLDRRLIEFVLGLPAEQFRRGPRSRWFMRRALRSVLPPPVLERSVKTDPARYRPWRQAFDEALPTVHRHLSARSEPPARAEYLDMPMLLAHLEHRIQGKHVRGGKLSRALALLDWHMD